MRYLFGLPARPPTPEPEPESKRKKKILGSIVTTVVGLGIFFGIKYGLF